MWYTNVAGRKSVNEVLNILYIIYFDFCIFINFLQTSLEILIIQAMNK